ncbi:MAG: S9 family peptidase [Gemmatimonadales bacterium]
MTKRRIGRAALAAGLLLLPVAASAQTKRAMTVDDFLGLKTAADPQVSPDGGSVAFTVSVPSLADNRNVSRLWLHSLADGSTRELTRGTAGSDFQPRWARDGRTLFFLSTRSGAPQVWRIRTDGGEPVRITNLPTGVNQFWWSPDTTAVFVASDLKWPATSALDERTKDFPTSAQLWDGLFYRHWNEWRAGVRQHLLRVELATGRTTDITPFDHDVPTLALGGEDVGISPLATELAVVYNADSVVATSTNNDIFLIGPDGTGLVAMTENKGNDHSPVYSPNARWIAYLSMATPGFEADRQQAMLYDRATGERVSLTADWDVSVQRLVWAPDLAVARRRGRGAGRAQPLPAPLPGTARRGAEDPSRGGRRLEHRRQFLPRGNGVVFLRQSANQPPELHLVRFDGREPMRRLTELNTTALAELDLRPAEQFAFVGAKGDSVHGFLIKPPGFDSTRRYPVAYLIHGGPQGAWLDNWHARWNYAMFASRGYVVAAVNFHGSTGYGQAFTNSISRHWGDLPYEDLMKGVQYLETLPYVDGARIGAAGGSYGGYMVYWIAGHTDRFKTLVAHDGIFNTESMAGTTEEQWFPIWEFGGSFTSPEARTLLAQWSPANFVTQWKTPMLIVHGQQDFRVDVSEGMQAFSALQLKGIKSQFLYFPDEGHFVLKPRNRRLWWGVVLDWLDASLKPAAARTGP